jgi:hypothetical protein
LINGESAAPGKSTSVNIALSTNPCVIKFVYIAADDVAEIVDPPHAC